MCSCIAYVVVLDVVVVVLKGHRDFVAVHARDGFVIPRIEPSVGFGGLFDAQGDHVAQVVLGADVGEVVRHVVKVGQRLFSVQNFSQLFSDFHSNASVVREVGSALAALRHRDELGNLRGFLANVRHSLGLGDSAGEVNHPTLGVLDRDHRHAGELADTQDNNLVLHGHTMGQESSFVQNFLHFSSTFFRPGFGRLGTHIASSTYRAKVGGGGSIPPVFLKKKFLFFLL